MKLKYRKERSTPVKRTEYCSSLLKGSSNQLRVNHKWMKGDRPSNDKCIACGRTRNECQLNERRP